MPVQFETPAGIRYSCTMCGDCCRSFNVLISKAEAEQVEALDWTGKRPDLAGVPKTQPCVDKALRGRQQLARRPDGSCVFLGANSRCAIHEHFGAEAKPLICRLYPFAFYPMGDRLGVDVAFTCNAVHQDHGPDVRDEVPEWVRVVFKDRPVADPGRHHLDAGKRIPGELVWEIEHVLLGFLADGALSFPQRVRACLQFLKLGTTGDPTAASAAVLRSAIAAGIPRQLAKLPPPEPLDPTQRSAFRSWLFLALNPQPLEFARMGTIERNIVQANRLEAGERFREGTGRPWIDNAEFEADFAAIEAVAPGVLAEPRQELLTRYFSAKIIGQKFLIAGDGELPLVHALRALFLYWPMAVWTARAMAAGHGAAEVSEPDLRRALRLLERSLGVLHTGALPAKQKAAMEFIFDETDLVLSAAVDQLGSLP